MSTENTSLKNTTPAGDSNTTNEMVIGKINTSQRTLLIVAGSLLALLVLIAVAGTSGGQITKGAVALANYQVDSANLALTKDIFGVGTVSENEKPCCINVVPGIGGYCCFFPACPPSHGCSCYPHCN